MIEDKLEPAQRIRLESLSQAVQVTAMGSVGGMLSALIPGNEERPPTSAELVIELASRFERWITGGGEGSRFLLRNPATNTLVAEFVLRPGESTYLSSELVLELPG